jgi:hypothetical protein
MLLVEGHGSLTLALYYGGFRQRCPFMAPQTAWFEVLTSGAAGGECHFTTDTSFLR